MAHGIHLAKLALTQMSVQGGKFVTRSYKASDFENLELLVDSCEIDFVHNPDLTET